MNHVVSSHQHGEAAGRSARTAWTALAGIALIFLSGGAGPCSSVEEQGNSNEGINESTDIIGIVLDDSGPVAGAVVRVQTTQLQAISDGEGSFVLSVGEFAAQAGYDPLQLTAWAKGYYIVGPYEAYPGDTDISITLKAHTTSDHSEYEWLTANSQDDGGVHCQQCHSDPDASDSMLPFDEWRDDAHGTSATNPRFLSMYRGEDLEGNQSSLTQYVFHRDYGRIPLPPDLDEDYYGPGYKLDFPDTAGNCAACHLPAAAANDPYNIDPDQVTGVGTEGITCDLCHKIWDVWLDPATGLPFDNMPGVLSMEFRRPEDGHQLFIGPLDDVAPGEDTYSAIYRESSYCAPCHSATFWGVEIYNSFGEWLESSYSDPETGQTCQDCHMPRRGATRFVREEEGGLERDPETIGSHLMPGAADQSLLQNTAELTITAERTEDTINVEITVTNTNAGHHIPTDSPLRNILLVVSAQDAAGSSLQLIEGSTLPEWAGDYAGQPGRGYAKILEELWTEVSPTAAYWNPTQLLSDLRLAAEEKDISHYTFVTADGEASITALLIFRRAFYELAQQKGWIIPDILMEEEEVTLPMP